MRAVYFQRFMEVTPTGIWSRRAHAPARRAAPRPGGSPATVHSGARRAPTVAPADRARGHHFRQPRRQLHLELGGLGRILFGVALARHLQLAAQPAQKLAHPALARFCRVRFLIQACASRVCRLTSATRMISAAVSSCCAISRTTRRRWRAHSGCGSALAASISATTAPPNSGSVLAMPNLARLPPPSNVYKLWDVGLKPPGRQCTHGLVNWPGPGRRRFSPPRSRGCYPHPPRRFAAGQGAARRSAGKRVHARRCRKGRDRYARRA